MLVKILIALWLSLEDRSVNPPTLFFFQNSYGYYRSFAFSHHLVDFCNKYCFLLFHWKCIKSIAQFGESWHWTMMRVCWVFFYVLKYLMYFLKAYFKSQHFVQFILSISWFWYCYRYLEFQLPVICYSM